MTAAAACPRAVLEYYHGLGVGFNEFYGMTEIGAATMTRPGIADLGTVGVPVPGYDIRLASDGEVLLRTDSQQSAIATNPRRPPRHSRPMAGSTHVAAWIVLEPAGIADDHAQANVAQAIAQVNATRDPRERIESHAILPDPWLPGDELTETLKLRRRILDKHSDTIARLYARDDTSTDDLAGVQGKHVP